MARRRNRMGLTFVGLALVLPMVLVESEQAVVRVSSAQVSGSALQIEGRATAGRPITVDGVTMATSGVSGAFRIDMSGYTRPKDCTVEMNDGSPDPTHVRLAGCRVPRPRPSPSQTPTQTPTQTHTPPQTQTPSHPPTRTPTSSPVAVESVSLKQTRLQGGATVAGTVTLTAPAPAGGALVSLESSNPADLTVPRTMTVPAGVSSYVTFVSTKVVSSPARAVVSATYPQDVTRSVTIKLTPPPPQPAAWLDSIFLDPSTVQSGTTRTTATLFFTALTPGPAGAKVSLSSDDTSVATVPSTVTVPARSSSGAFDVSVGSAGTATIAATYKGVTRSAVLTVSAKSTFRIITESPLPNATVGENYAGFIEACCGQGSPYRWSLVKGRVPDGLTFAGDDLRLTRTTGVTGVATRVQTTTFTVRARDGAGNTSTKTFRMAVDPADPVVITNQDDQLADAKVGVPYEVGVFASGGVTARRWSHVAGTLPPGLAVQASPGRVNGTPTTAGDYTFTLRVDDSSGQFATRQFSILVAPEDDPPSPSPGGPSPGSSGSPSPGSPGPSPSS